MLTKTIVPIKVIRNTVDIIIVGTLVEYRIFRMLICRKILITPEFYGKAREYDMPYRF